MSLVLTLTAAVYRPASQPAESPPAAESDGSASAAVGSTRLY